MKTRIMLRDHQIPMSKKINELYKAGKNFVGNILATGGGKSFIAMDQIIKFANEYNEDHPIEDNKNPRVFSNLPGYYVSPTNIILYQFKLHMAQNIIGPEYILNYEEENGQIEEGREIEVAQNLLKEMNPRIKLDDINFEEIMEDSKSNKSSEEPISARSVVDSIIKGALEQIDTPQLEKIAEDAFPNMNFTTYQALEQKSASEIKKIKTNLIILDEAHRSGAEKWWEKIKLLITNSNAKVLAITATPERDVDERDMMRDLALLDTSGYSVREVRNQKHLAGNMPLLKAIESENITSPEVVHFNCTLDETPEFESALKIYIKAVQNVKTSRSGEPYYKAMQYKKSIETNFKEMLLLVRKDPLIDYDDSLTPEEKLSKKEADEENIKKQIYQEKGINGEPTGIIADIIKIAENGIKEKPEDVLKNCMEVINSEEWQKLKQQRIATIIEKETVSREIEKSKAISFIESMDKATKKEADEEKNNPEKKKERAKSHISKKIKEIEKLFEGSSLAKPIVTAVHSLAFSDAENKKILNEFMKKNKTGGMKIIAAVNKFNEGFHPDGIRCLFMTKPIAQNKNKDSEPRIILLQQIGRCLSAGKKDASVIFDIACNFMRNHEKFKTESEKKCFSFLKLTRDEQKFLDLSKEISNEKTRKSEKQKEPEKILAILDALTKNGVKINSETITKNLCLEDVINSIKDENLREKILDDLFINEIELSKDSKFNLDTAYRTVRNTYLGIEENQTVLKKISDYSVPQMLKLGIIETETEEGRKTLEGRINKAGFIVRGVLEDTFAYNVYTGTKFDGSENDPLRKDYYGCGPDGKDPAGYDKDGFNDKGIHRITGKHYDERHFVREKTIIDGKEETNWYYENPETGERSVTDPLGYNHEGINPDTGFDRQGYWHRKKEVDGKKNVFSIIRSKLNDNKEDVHGFVFKGNGNLGLFQGIKMKFKNEQGLHSNGSIEQSGITRDKDKYGYDGKDIDGFDPRGFNENGIHRDTSTRYGLDGRDKNSRLQPDLAITKSILELIKLKKLSKEEIVSKLGRTEEEIDKVIGNAYSISRILDEISQRRDKGNLDVIGIIKETKSNPKAIDMLFELSPSLRSQVENSVDDKRKMNEYLEKRTTEFFKEFSQGKYILKPNEKEELEKMQQKLATSSGAVKYREPNDDDFVL